jgi:phosphate transport system substrate-binding protein
MRKTTILSNTFIVIQIVFSITFVGCGSKEKTSANANGSLEGTITLSGAFALYPLANKWAEEFGKIHPDVRFNISAGGAGKGMADALAQAVDLGMLSREIKPDEINIGAWPVAVTKDAVVPTINPANPAAVELKLKGLSRDELIKIFVTGEISTWGQVAGGSHPEKINVYTRSDASGAAATWAQYLGQKEQDLLKGLGVFGDPGLADAVKKDASGIGYNNVIYVYDLTSKNKHAGMDVIPLDINGDDQLTPNELFYSNLDSLVAAIGDGRYPSPPARELYFVSKGKPESEVVKAFLRWVLKEGQQYVAETGYISLSQEKIQAELDKLK